MFESVSIELQGATLPAAKAAAPASAESVNSRRSIGISFASAVKTDKLPPYVGSPFSMHYYISVFQRCALCDTVLANHGRANGSLVKYLSSS